MGLKVKMVEINGEKRVPPEVMDLLVRLGQHRQFYQPCESMLTGKGGDYCSIGREIVLKLADQPEVTFYQD